MNARHPEKIFQHKTGNLEDIITDQADHPEGVITAETGHQ